jgi:hypothetical protein
LAIDSGAVEYKRKSDFQNRKAMDIQATIQQAQSALNRNDTASARSLLKSIIQQEPGNVAAWLLLADAIEQPDRAKQCLERVLKLDPFNPIALKKLDELENPFAELYAFDQPPATETAPFSAPTAAFELESEPEQQPELSATPAFTTGFEGFDFSETPEKPESASPTPKPSAPRPKKSTQKKVKKKPPPKKTRWLEISLIVIVVMCLCVVGAVLIGQSAGAFQFQTQPQVTPTVEDVRYVIFENINAANAEDIDRYMETIHPRATGRTYTQETLEDLNGKFDLSYEVSNIKIMRMEDEEADVYMVLTTKKIRGPEFRNNRLALVMTLRLYEGSWKIYGQEVTDTQYLD